MKINTTLFNLLCAVALIFSVHYLQAQDCPAAYTGIATNSEDQCNDNLAFPNVDDVFGGLVDGMGQPFTGSGAVIAWNIDPLTILPAAVPPGVCDPVSTTYVATVECLSGTVLFADIYTYQVNVFPGADAYSVDVIAGDCGQLSAIVASPGSCDVSVVYNEIIPADPAACPAGADGSFTYTATPANGGSCWSESGGGIIPACDTCADCPDPSNFIPPPNFAACSGALITLPDLSDFVDTNGNSGATFSWTSDAGFDSMGASTGSEVLVNTDCAPLVVTYTYGISCTATGENLGSGAFSVTVFPTDVSAFVTATDGICEATVTVDPSCAGVLTVTQTSPASFPAQAGTSGTATWDVAYIGDDILPTECVTDFTVSANYDCPSEECPVSTYPGQLSYDVCSGDVVALDDLAGFVSSTDNVEFLWTGSNGFNSNGASSGSETLTNTGCAPMTVTYTYNILCTLNGGSVIDQGSFNVTVYPTDISSFVTAVPGGCTATFSVMSGCENFITVTPYNASTGEVGVGTVTASLNGSSCAPLYTESVAVDCSVDCPSFVSSSISANEVCSGQALTVSVQLSNSTNAIASVTVGGQSTTLTGAGNGLFTGNVVLTNADCNASTSNLNIVAICTDDNSILAMLNETVTVYPSSLNAFVNVSSLDGCNLQATVNAGCENVISIAGSPVFMGAAGTSGTATFNFTYSGDAPCLANSFSVDFPYNCAPMGDVCPMTNVQIPASMDVCGGQSVVLPDLSDFLFITDPDQNGFVSYNWIATNGYSSNGASSGSDTPVNNTCNVQTVIYSYSITCDLNGALLAQGSMSANVYPSNLAAFATANDGECSTSVTIDPTCGSNIIVTPPSQTAAPGTSGQHNYMLVWNGGGTCSDVATITANYNCAGQMDDCPTAIIASASSLQACDGEVVSLSATSNNGSAINTTWTDQNGNAVANPSAVTVTSNGCAPGSFTYTVLATCVDNPAVSFTETVTVTAYPSDISVYVTPNFTPCSATFTVQSGCEPYINVTSYTAAAGEMSMVNVSASANNNFNCSASITQTANIDCPGGGCFAMAPTISSDNPSICIGDGEVVNISLDSSSPNDQIVYVVTDATGTTILAGPTTDTQFNFDGAPAGTCLIWAVAHDGTLVAPTDQVADLQGCYALSNPVSVIREDCNLGGFDCGTCFPDTLVFCTNPITPVEICLDCDGSNVSVTDVESLFFCSIENIDDLDGCFTYTPLPNMENFSPDILTATVCEPGTNNCCEVVIQVDIQEDCTPEPVDCEELIEVCTAPITPVDICIDCLLDGSIEAEIDTIYSLWGCSINMIGDACFEYVPLPNLEDFGGDTVIVEYCDNAGNCYQTTVAIAVTEDCEDVEPPVVDETCIEYYEGCIAPLETFDFCLDCTSGMNTTVVIDSIYSLWNCTINMQDDFCFEYVALPNMDLVPADTVYIDYCDTVTNECSTALLVMTFNDCDDDGNVIPNGGTAGDQFNGDMGSLGVQNDDTVVDIIDDEDDVTGDDETSTVATNEDGQVRDNFGASEVVYSDELHAYPIPSSDFLYINVNLDATEKAELVTYNAQGQLVESKIVYTVDGNAVLKLNIQAYAKGVYFVSLKQKGIVKTSQFIKN